MGLAIHLITECTKQFSHFELTLCPRNMISSSRALDFLVLGFYIFEEAQSLPKQDLVLKPYKCYGWCNWQHSKTYYYVRSKRDGQLTFFGLFLFYRTLLWPVLYSERKWLLTCFRDIKVKHRNMNLAQLWCFRYFLVCS